MAETKPTPAPWFVENIMYGRRRITHGEPTEDGFRDDIDLSSSEQGGVNIDAIVASYNDNVALRAQNAALREALLCMVCVVEEEPDCETHWPRSLKSARAALALPTI